MDRVNEITKDCFNALIQIRQLDESMQPPPQVLHDRLRAFIDTMQERAAQMGLRHEDAQDIAYAIVALADEVALSKSGNVRQYWMTRPLQLHYFNENVAGDNFFVRLQAIRQDPRRVDVLRVYYLCLLFGFQGRYRIRGGEVELGDITEGVRQDLARARALGGAEVLSPNGDRPPEAASRVRRNMPLLWLSLAAVVLSVALYVGLRINLSSEAASVVQRIDELNR